MNWKAEIAEQRLAGPILRVTFMNASGDAVTAPVASVMRQLIDVHKPVAFLIDLSQAHYSGGDGICGSIAAHGSPLAIVAHGDDRECIHRTLQITQLLQLCGDTLFAREDDALHYLQDRLGAG